MYTDPQMHTVGDEVKFGLGKGNLGQKGIAKFLKTHQVGPQRTYSQCNAICRYLRLTPINEKEDMLLGTVPNQPFMTKQQVEHISGSLNHSHRS